MDENEEDGFLLCINCWHLARKTVIMDCGHPICLFCLQRSFLPFCCTACSEFSHLRTTQADIVFRPEGEGICEIHREDQKLFCESSTKLLCITCSKSEEHELHIHWPIAVAALRRRKSIQINLENCRSYVKKIEELRFKENWKPLEWAVVWTDDKEISRKKFEKKMQIIWEYLKKKKLETVEMEKLIVEKGNEKLSELYQKLKEMETAQDYDIKEKKMQWEAMLSTESNYLRNKIRMLKEKDQQTNVELLQNLTNTQEWRYLDINLEPFFLQIETSFLNVATEFLKLFHASGLSEIGNSYNFSEEKKIITFVPSSSRKTYAIYTTGNFQTNSIRIKVFLRRFWTPDSIEEQLNPRSITTFWTAILEE